MSHKFKLQTVLNYRQTLEDQAQQMLTASLQQLRDIDAELARQQLSLQQYDSELRRRQQEGLTVAEMDLFETQIQHCRRLMTQLQQQQAQLERRIVSEREELLLAARNKQVIEKLKDKQAAEYLKELSRKEREMLDEISLRNRGART